MIRVELERQQGDFGFVAKDEAGHQVSFDSSLENGGADFGIRPMQALLMALGSCSGIDIVSILKKQHQLPSRFFIRIQGEREQEGAISLWKRIEVVFEFHGDLDEEKLNRACSLSVEKYCSVAETLRRAGASISWKAVLKNESFTEK